MSDLISRQAAIDAALTFLVEYCGAAFDEDMQTMLCERFDALPSDDFVEYLLDVISPNEMEMYKKMYEERAKYNG